MDQRVTILPISPDHFWPGLALLGLLLATSLIYGALRQTGRPHLSPIWEDIPEKGRVLTIVLGLLWLGLFGLTIWAAYVGLWQAVHPKPGAPPTGQSSLGFGALLTALLGAPFLIWGTWLKYQTVRYQKEGHITDRINRAVEMLGAEKTVKHHSTDDAGKAVTVEETVPNIEVRIGAILSLERIAQDSTTHDRGRDHVRVMEILCAYVRENSNARKPKDSWRQIWQRESESSEDDPGLSEEEFMEKHRLGHEHFELATSISGLQAWARMLEAPRVDILLALQVLGRRTVEQRKVEATWPDPPVETTVWPFDIPCPDLPEEPDGSPTTARALSAFREKLEIWKDQIRHYKGYRLDLSGANLQGANLSARRRDGSDAVLSGANLSGVRMEGATVQGVRLQGAELEAARLDGALLQMAILDGAVFKLAWMEGADLAFARIRGSDLQQARLRGANLEQARMQETRFFQARIDNANAHFVQMQGADLKEARMNGTKLRRARMEGANLHASGIDKAKKLRNVTFHGAAFREIVLTNMEITQDQMNSAFADGSVTLPAWFERPGHWPTSALQDAGKHAFYKELEKWRGDPAKYNPPPPSA